MSQLYSLLGALAPFAFLIQIALCVHVYRTGRPYYWMLILFIAPFIGALAYLLVEVLPDTRMPRLSGVDVSIFTPRRVVISRLRELLEESDIVEVRLALAEQLFLSGEKVEALSVAAEAVRGAFRDDPHLLACVTRYEVELGRFEEAAQRLARIKVQADRMLGFEVELLRGRIALGLGRVAEARLSLSKAESTHLGEEPRYYLGECLVAEQRSAEAIQHFEEICRKYRKGSRAWRRAEKTWFKRSKQRVKELRLVQAKG